MDQSGSRQVKLNLMPKLKRSLVLIVMMIDDSTPLSNIQDQMQKEWGSRKRKRNIQEWKDNIRKRRRNTGLSYTIRAGKAVER